MVSEFQKIKDKIKVSLNRPKRQPSFFNGASAEDLERIKEEVRIKPCCVDQTLQKENERDKL